MELAYFIAVILVASILQGITGFGSALVAAPLLLLLIDKTTSVVALSFVSIALNGFLLATIKYPIDRKTFYNLLIPILTGLPVGIFILQALDINLLRLIVGVLSIMFAFLLFSNKLRVENSKSMRIFSGWFSGILHTSTGVGGPPVVLLLASENTDKDEMRKTLALIFLSMSIVSVFLFFLTSNLTDKSILYGTYAIPAAFIGGYVGNIVSKKVSQKQFIASVFLLVSITIALALYSAVKYYFF